MTIDQLRQLALGLNRNDRELLGVELLSSLESPESQVEVDAALATEILARSAAFRSGTIQALDAAGTNERIRQKLAARNAP